ncbi:amidinotransferase [Pseudomonas silvicola]|nr:amidinotransferase [Pseudomonas silvicola]
MSISRCQVAETVKQVAGLSPVSTFNEWDPLEEVIVGVIDDIRMPDWDRSLEAVIPKRHQSYLKSIAGSRFEEAHVQRARSEVDGLADLLSKLGVKVRRPDAHDHFAAFATPFFNSNGGYYSAMPRDGMLAIGNKIIETPMAWRSRYFETFPYRSILIDYFRQGAHVVSAPKPMLKDSMWIDEVLNKNAFESVIGNDEPLFDAADFIKVGRDIIGQRSHVTNQLGVDWLRRELGSRFNVHVYSFDDNAPMHIDTTILPLAPDKVLVNPAWVSKIPDFFRDWEVLVAPPSQMPDNHPLYMTSKWIHMNVLSLDERTVIVERQEHVLIAAFRKWGFEVVPCDFQNFQSFGGSFHCATLDIRRTGRLASYRADA